MHAQVTESSIDRTSCNTQLFPIPFPPFKMMLAHRRFMFPNQLPSWKLGDENQQPKGHFVGTQGDRKAWLLTETAQQSQGRELSNRADIWNPGAQGTPSLGVLESSPADHGSGCPTCSSRTIYHGASSPVLSQE